MAITEEYSLVPLDPGKSLLRCVAPGKTSSLAERTGAPIQRHEHTETCSTNSKSLRKQETLSVYSFRRTIEASRVTATGLVVDIFV
jgi:hypothetical protein